MAMLDGFIEVVVSNGQKRRPRAVVFSTGASIRLNASLLALWGTPQTQLVGVYVNQKTRQMALKRGGPVPFVKQSCGAVQLAHREAIMAVGFVPGGLSFRVEDGILYLWQDAPATEDQEAQ